MQSAFAVVAACLAGCGGDAKPPAVDADLGPQWWQPKPGEVKNWDIQLNLPPAPPSSPIDVSMARAMYDLDLWALVPSPTMIDYGDGDPVMVPAGALAGRITQLHARTPPAIVICHVETGALDLSLPDARKFPGFKADPATIPDKPANPEPGSVIGWRVVTPTKRWLDIREASRAKWIDIMFKRFELARQIGCDGVEPDRNLVAYVSANGGTGFDPISFFDSYSWHDEIAKQGHDRKLSTGMKNGDVIADQIDKGATKFDWLMIERCGETMSCDAARPFIDLQKAVFAIDYDHDSNNDPQGFAGVCQQQRDKRITDGIYKDVELTSKAPTLCNP